jgi:hypothetical protein
VQKRSLQAFQGGAKADPPDQDEDEREGAAEYGVIPTPVVLSVLLECPSCQMQLQVAAKLQTRVTRDQDGSGALALRVRSAKTMHLCGQQALGLVEGPRER